MQFKSHIMGPQWVAFDARTQNGCTLSTERRPWRQEAISAITSRLLSSRPIACVCVHVYEAVDSTQLSACTGLLEEGLWKNLMFILEFF